MTSAVLHLFLVAALLVSYLDAAEDHWGYPDLDAGEEFPDWGGVCSTGRRQSPINLSQRGALKGDYSDFNFRNYDEPQAGVTMVNNGHTIQLSGFAEEMELEGGPLDSHYVVEQIHLHWWSEHTVELLRFPLEVHIVHRNLKYANMSDATGHRDGLAVLGILYHVSNEPNDAIEDILEHLDEVKNATQLNKPIKMSDDFVIENLFPEVAAYYTYSGSLTTPSCNEVVTWIVLEKSFPVTLEQVERFQEVEYDVGKMLTNNYRNIQANNNRPVVYVRDADLLDELKDTDDAAGTHLPAMSLGGLLLAVYAIRALQ